MILGTAGHVDHGKTALVRALTGVDTDRLAEEKRRGITIELGFAPLELGDHLQVSIVDVPGHEAFVRTMLAGATGLDVALLVVAADEGVMPQTREHLEILQLLGTASGVVALTKCDLVDDEWMTLVEDELRQTLAATPLGSASIVRTSAVTGMGLGDLRSAIETAVRAVPARSADDLFRLPVDRTFTVHGTGTVVTGTVWSGTLARDSRVIVLPGGTRARVRAIESHGTPVDRAVAGTRTALALTGVEVADVCRGSVVVADDCWRPTATVLAEVALLDTAPTLLGARQRVRLHLGTQDVEARVVASGGGLRAGERRQARLILSALVTSRAGDRFVLRAGSPVTTIGGGVVNDPLPARPRPRPWTRAAANPLERMTMLLELEGELGIAIEELPLRTGVAPTATESLLALHSPEPVQVAGRIYDAAHVVELEERIRGLVDSYHQADPLEPGMPLRLLRSQVGSSAPLADLLVSRLVSVGELLVHGAIVARSSFQPVLSSAQAQLASAVLQILSTRGREPPTVAEIELTLGPAARAILRHLEREGRVTEVEPGRYFERRSLEEMIELVRGAMTRGQPLSPAELRDLIGVSRKYLIPFLEYCDRVGITVRAGDGRVAQENTAGATKVGRGSA